MSLFTATIIIAIVLIAKGLVWLTFPKWADKMRQVFLRSTKASIIIFGIASVWFLWNVAHLGESDFGQYRGWLLILFGLVAVGSFVYLKDFLAVRGLAILLLLISNVLLDAAYMQPPLSRLFLVALVYVMIIQALYFGAVPYKMRDFSDWIFSRKLRVKQFAIGFIAYGLVLTVAAFTY